MHIDLKERVIPRGHLTAKILTNSFKFSLHVTYSICQLNDLQHRENLRSQKPKVLLILQVWLSKMEMSFLTNKRSNLTRMCLKRQQIYTMISTSRELILVRQKDDRKLRIVYRRQRTCFLCLKCKSWGQGVLSKSKRRQYRTKKSNKLTIFQKKSKKILNISLQA